MEGSKSKISIKNDVGVKRKVLCLNRILLFCLLQKREEKKREKRNVQNRRKDNQLRSPLTWLIDRIRI